MQTRGKRQFTPPVQLPRGNPNDEEVFSIVSVDDSSGSSVVAEAQPNKRVQKKRKKTDEVSPRPRKRMQPKLNGRRSGRSAKGKRWAPTQPEAALTISDDDSSKGDRLINEEDEDDIILEDVEMLAAGEATDTVTTVRVDGSYAEPEEDDEIELEDVDYDEAETENQENAYAAAYEAAGVDGTNDGEQQPVVFKDGKGQPGGLSISLNGPSKSATSRSAKRATRVITPRDRQIRLAAHKWTVLSMVAHARWRNDLINDDSLRDDLYAMVPNAFLEKLRLIHPKKVPVQSERVRQFEIFLKDLTRWWSHKFHLDPVMTTYGALRQPDNDMLAGDFPRVGRRVDGWIVESALEREDRHREERRQRNGKGKAKAAPNGKARKGKHKSDKVIAIDTLESEVKPHRPLSEITLFGIGESTTPVYLRLSEEAEIIASVDDFRKHVQTMSGSRETNAQLYAAMCRALGMPARLVISIQAPSWSAGAAKIAATAGATDASAKKAGDLVKRKREHVAEAKRKKELQKPYKPLDVMTSDDESFTATASDSYDEGAAKVGRSRKRNATASVGARSSKTGSSVSSPKPSTSTPARPSAPERSGSGASVKETTPPEKSKGKARRDDGDYRNERWRGLDAPLEVKFQPKLRIAKPKALKESEVAGAEPDIAPVDLASPPTMWVEVFSKPWQKWITVDPVRGMVEPLSNRQMEPSPSDKHNRLVYVLAFEEDGFARDVTARYTRTLHSRVSRMRPPPSTRKTVGDESLDWWSRVVAAVHRPQRLDRDAAEDIELEASASREPMPSSVAAFKEHPVYTLEKHLKRDEVIYPAKQAGTFQGTPVFMRSNVLACRSARQWYNDGRTVREGEEALKWVKSRGYTLANKRAEEEARQQGLDGLQEGLYALFQTELYRAPAVIDGRVPTNSFGNIDLFVDTMLPPGGAHIPYNGAGKVAKKLGINYAEAIVGFEFRKHRSMPKLKGIVVPEEHAGAVTEAYWASEHMQAEREMVRKRDRLFKNWKKLLNAIKIQERVQREYGGGGSSSGVRRGAAETASVSVSAVEEADSVEKAPRVGGKDEEHLDAYHNIDQQNEVDTAGGFLVD